MKKRNPPNPAKGCASELYDLQSNRSEKGGVVRAGEKVRLNHEKKLKIWQPKLNDLAAKIKYFRKMLHFGKIPKKFG